MDQKSGRMETLGLTFSEQTGFFLLLILFFSAPLIASPLPQSPHAEQTALSAYSAVHILTGVLSYLHTQAHSLPLLKWSHSFFSKAALGRYIFILIL